MYKIAQEKKPVRTHLFNFMVEGMVALNSAHLRAQAGTSEANGRNSNEMLIFKKDIIKEAFQKY